MIELAELQYERYQIEKSRSQASTDGSADEDRSSLQEDEPTEEQLQAFPEKTKELKIELKAEIDDL